MVIIINYVRWTQVSLLLESAGHLTMELLLLKLWGKNHLNYLSAALIFPPFNGWSDFKIIILMQRPKNANPAAENRPWCRHKTYSCKTEGCKVEIRNCHRACHERKHSRIYLRDAVGQFVSNLPTIRPCYQTTIPAITLQSRSLNNPTGHSV